MITEGKFHPKNGGPEERVSGGTPRTVTDGGAFGAFIAAMRSRKAQDNNCDAEVAHYSAALCHLGNISYRLGESAKFDERSEERRVGKESSNRGSACEGGTRRSDKD